MPKLRKLSLSVISRTGIPDRAWTPDDIPHIDSYPSLISFSFITSWDLSLELGTILLKLLHTMPSLKFLSLETGLSLAIISDILGRSCPSLDHLSLTIISRNLDDLTDLFIIRRDRGCPIRSLDIRYYSYPPDVSAALRSMAEVTMEPVTWGDS